MHWISNAVVVMPAEFSAQEKKAVSMLVEEVEKRTQLRWPIQNSWAAFNGPVIAVASQSQKSSLTGHFSTELKPENNLSEGFRLVTSAGQGETRSVFIIGNDSRGVLFGIGKLLRELHMGRRTVSIADNLDLTTAPKYPLRGHQLGYRPKCNSYDAWDLPVWEQYFRDLAVFGSNAIELIPPRSDDDSDSPAFSPPAHGDDGWHVRSRRCLWPGRLDLVSRDGQGLLQPADNSVRSGAMGGCL